MWKWIVGVPVVYVVVSFLVLVVESVRQERHGLGTEQERWRVAREAARARQAH